jgi:circadian clock protein KaiC
MLRYQQQYAFFDAAKLGDGTIRFIHLGQEALDEGMAKVLAAIVEEVERSSPGIVVVDSFRAVVRSTLAAGASGELALTDFMQRLAIALTSCEATTFLIGEYARRRTRQRGVHGGRRPGLALPGRRSQLRSCGRCT